MGNVHVQRGTYSVNESRVEVVERKGDGHPDTLVDSIVEDLSLALCREYIAKTGRILHHNVDKAQICGGATEVGFGQGRFTKPIYVLLGGRATYEALGKKVDVQGIALETTKKRFAEVAGRYIDINDPEQVQIEPGRISASSRDLVDIFMRNGGTQGKPLSNDTSFGVGYAPLSVTERVTLETERYLNSLAYKAREPSVGKDIKVMALREGDRIKLTVAVAFIAHHIKDIRQYEDAKARVRDDIETKVRSIISEMGSNLEPEIHVNTGDDPKSQSVYITHTGLSCEMGDDGSVGRGNRVNGLITPMRQMSLEAAAGKNPVNHVGKIYTLFAFDLADRIIAEFKGDVAECNIMLLSQIGKPITEPKNVNLFIRNANGTDYDAVAGRVERFVQAELEHIPDITEKVVSGKIKTVF